jgi:hypothetical protein
VLGRDLQKEAARVSPARTRYRPVEEVDRIDEALASRITGAVALASA